MQTYLPKLVFVVQVIWLVLVIVQWKEKQLSDVLVLATATADGKVNLITAISSDAVKEGYKAGDLIKAIAPKVGGGGGGRPDLAQAGGKKPEGIQEALKAAEDWLNK